MASTGRRLRSGYTTGACAAAAAKAAVMLLLYPEDRNVGNASVEIPFPDGSRVTFTAYLHGVTREPSGSAALASVVKDGGDDPDVTNGAEISASARIATGVEAQGDFVVIRGGSGVGRVTKPGLSVSVGEPAITAIPRSMIRQAVHEALSGDGGLAGDRRIDFRGQVRGNLSSKHGELGTRLRVREAPAALLVEGATGYPLAVVPAIEITISVLKGEELAKKTLNTRLGIVGGISILGTSGIVRPLSSEAWTSTITASMDVAQASGIDRIVLSVGRVSERAHMKRYAFAEEAYVMMGDYFEFSLTDARRHGFKRIHISAQWAKMLKISMSTPQTHARHGTIDTRKGAEHLNGLGIAITRDRDFNTAREIYDYLVATYGFSLPMFRKICVAAKRYAEGITAGIPVIAHLVSYEGTILVDSE